MAKRRLGPKPKDDGTIEKVRKLHCPYCDTDKSESMFYVSTDPLILTGRTSMCKECAEKIARGYNEKSGKFSDCTQTSVCAALERLDKPFLQSVWDGSVREVQDDSLAVNKTNAWAAYIKNITSLKQYKTMRWRDGDLFEKEEAISSFNLQENALDPDSEQYALYKKNKKAVINFVGWDPFKGYPREDELPLLYAQILAFLDEETKNDGQKLNASIQIVKLFNQAEKLNSAIDELQTDTKKMLANTAALKTLREAASKAISDANALAKDNGISVNFNSNKSKGANTLSGKIKELTNIGLREAQINTYDIGTCEGMKQVAMISEECRHRQINYIVCVPSNWFVKYPLNCWKPLRATWTTK